jgi:hypothetical protein
VLPTITSLIEIPPLELSEIDKALDEKNTKIQSLESQLIDAGEKVNTFIQSLPKNPTEEKNPEDLIDFCYKLIDYGHNNINSYDRLKPELHEREGVLSLEIYNLRGRELDIKELLVIDTEIYQIAKLAWDNNVDLIHLSPEDFTNQAIPIVDYWITISRTEHDIATVAENFDTQVGEILIKPITEKIHELAENILKPNSQEKEEQTLSQLSKILEIVRQNPYWDNIKAADKTLPHVKSVQTSIVTILKGRETLSDGVKQELLKIFEENEAFIYKLLADKLSDYTTDEKHLALFNITPSEAQLLRERNWLKVNSYIQEITRRYEEGTKPTTLDLDQIAILANKFIVPTFFRGHRKIEQNVSIGPVGKAIHEGISANNLHQAMDTLINKGLDVVDVQNEFLFDMKMADLLVEYLDIHPLNDGNGTCAIFFVEMLNSFRGRPMQEHYAVSWEQRIKETLRNNLVATAICYAKIAKLAYIGNRKPAKQTPES